MSYRAPRDASGIFFKLPSDLQLPLYDSERGYSVRDESISDRVQRALLDDYASPALTKPVLHERERERRAWWKGWMEAVRRAVASLLAYAGAFSLGMLAGRC